MSLYMYYIYAIFRKTITLTYSKPEFIVVQNKNIPSLTYCSPIYLKSQYFYNTCFLEVEYLQIPVN